MTDKVKVVRVKTARKSEVAPVKHDLPHFLGNCLMKESSLKGVLSKVLSILKM